MKLLVLFYSTFYLAAASADKPAIFCRAIALQRGPDHGYMVRIADGRESAQVSTQSIAGPRELAALNCKTPESGDQCSVALEGLLLHCTDSEFGYSVSLTIDSDGKITGTLTRGGIVGTEFLANLECR